MVANLYALLLTHCLLGLNIVALLSLLKYQSTTYGDVSSHVMLSCSVEQLFLLAILYFLTKNVKFFVIINFKGHNISLSRRAPLLSFNINCNSIQVL